MRELLQRHKETIVTFLAVVVPLFLLYVHGRNPKQNTIATNVLMEVTSPAVKASHDLISSIQGVWFGYVALIDTEDENTSLQDKVDELEGVIVEAQQLRDENALLRKELNFKRNRKELVTVSAHVIGRDVSGYARVLRVHLDTGAYDGLREGMPVLTNLGLVGRLRQVSDRYAEVMLTVDTRSEVAVKVVGKAVTGSVRGKGERNRYSAKMLVLPNAETLEVGDRIVTSGHDQVFPPNLEVGQISSLKDRQEGVYQALEVSPSVNFGVLEVVQIVVGVKSEDVDASLASERGRR